MARKPTSQGMVHVSPWRGDGIEALGTEHNIGTSAVVGTQRETSGGLKEAIPWNRHV